MTAFSDDPTGAGRVPAIPVVAIEIRGDVVSVDGAVIAHDGSRSLHHIAVHAAAERVAAPLGRPVRAEATDSEGRARFLVHPDGHASDVVLIESFDSASAPPTTPLAPPAAARTPAPAPPPSSGAPQGWPSKVVRTIAVAAALVAVVGMGVLLLTNRSGDTDVSARDASSTTGPEPTQEPSPVAASASESAEGSTSSEPSAEPSTASRSEGPELTVTPLAGTNALRLTIDLDSAAPGGTLSAAVVVTATGADPVRRTVTLDSASTEVSVGRLPGGPATWEVRIEGLPVQQGAATIQGPYVAPLPTPATPAAPAAPTPTSTQAVPQAPATSKPASKPAPKAAPKAKSKQKAQPKSKIKGSTPKPTSKIKGS